MRRNPVCMVRTGKGVLAYAWKAFITFVVLHCIAVSSLIARSLVRFPMAALVLGVAIIAAGLTLPVVRIRYAVAQLDRDDDAQADTEDHVPLAPWLGVVL